MFYCDGCAKEKEYPVSMARSLGSCEICGNKRVCNDVPTWKVHALKDDARRTEGVFEKLEETVEKTHLRAIQQKLDLKAFAKQVKEKLAAVSETKGQVHADGFMKTIKYLGSHEFTDLDMIMAAYHNHEFLVFFKDGASVSFDTDQGSFYWEIIEENTEETASQLADAEHLNSFWVEIYDIHIPNARRVFAKQL